jgi:TonB family protein
MDRTQKRCLTASAMFHGALLGVFALASAFSRPAPPPASVPVMEFISPDTTLTDGQHAGGGSPQADPPPANPPRVAQDPPREPNKPSKPPEREPIKAPVEKPPKTKTPQREPEPAKPVQDVDDTRRPKKPQVVVSGNRTKRADPHTTTERQDREAQEQETRDRRDREIAAANSARQQLANRLRGGAESIAQGTGASTSITMPGPGGAAYAPYISYLDLFYRTRWRSPKASSKSTASVKVSVEIAKDGTVLNYDLLVPSGNRELDESVRDLLKRYPKLRPLPDTSKDSKRLFTIQFRLDADTAL